LVASLLAPYCMNWAKISVIKVSHAPERLSAHTEMREVCINSLVKGITLFNMKKKKRSIRL